MTPNEIQVRFDIVVCLCLVHPRARFECRINVFYLQHVLSFKDCFCDERAKNLSFTALKTFCDFNNACQRQAHISDRPESLVTCGRYLLEIYASTDLGRSYSDELPGLEIAAT